ncbi:MAG: GNAT family N-acetyltransferase [Verrucomicrobia bacterium]|nr:GNAT family N-acetyltransferase [Verrucomicrobiota bacterium]MBS0637577.1 GNAT family N-acetyltransferase [Verrucomicrobiota bacterium]
MSTFSPEAFNMQIAPGFTLAHFSPKDEQALYTLFREVAGKDGYFPNESDSFDEFHKQFFAANSEVFICRSDATGEVVAGFYIKPNFSGRGSHIANAAYMVAKSHRGKGLGTNLVLASLTLAKNHGFRAMQYNMVLSDNTRALNLYKKLGFSIIGSIPEAIRNSDGSYQDGYILHKKLAV